MLLHEQLSSCDDATLLGNITKVHAFSDLSSIVQQSGKLSLLVDLLKNLKQEVLDLALLLLISLGASCADFFHVCQDVKYHPERAPT